MDACVGSRVGSCAEQLTYLDLCCIQRRGILASKLDHCRAILELKI